MWNVKEKPFIDAASKSGPLPSFLFANPYFTGFFAMLMCPVFGAVFLIFWVAGNGGVEALELYKAARLGGYATMIFGAIVFISIAVSAFTEPEEKTYRLKFFTGGVFGLIFLLITDALTVGPLTDYFGLAGPLI